MTTKTETLYRIKEEHLTNDYFMEVIQNRCEPVTVHVVDDLYRKKVGLVYHLSDGKHYQYEYEKVTHVFPMTEGMFPKSVSGTSSDDYEWVYIDLNDAKITDQIWNSNGLGWIDLDDELLKTRRDRYKDNSPCRRKVSKSELKKKVEELTRMSDSLRSDSNGFYSQLRNAEETIESQKREIDRLKSDLAEMQTDRDVFALSNARLEKELEEAKKGVVKWEPSSDKSNKVDVGLNRLIVYFGGNSCTIPLPPKPRTIDDEAQEALDKELEEAKKGGVVWSEDPFKENGTSDLWVNAGLKNIQVYYKGLSTLIPIPPLPRTIEDEANEAWEKSETNHYYIEGSQENKYAGIGYKAGFKAAKEAQNG